MSKEYVQLFLDGMRKSGYDVGEYTERLFESIFEECLEDAGYKEITAKVSFDHELFCAALAQLMTSGRLGCSNHGPYNIKVFWGLSDEQVDFVLNNIPARLVGFAKGAILAEE